MAFWQYTGPGQKYPTLGIHVLTNDIVDFGTVVPPGDGNWSTNAGPATVEHPGVFYSGALDNSRFPVGGGAADSISSLLTQWALAQSYRVVSASRDANEAITTASIVWPDGSTGTFTTDTASTLFPGAIDAYHVTYVPSVGASKTVTQAAVTRDLAGAVTAQPALTIV